MSESVRIALISGGCSILVGIFSLVGVYIANSKSAALVQYRLEELEKKVDKHNNVIERTYKLEERTELQEAELERHKERLRILEEKA